MSFLCKPVLPFLSSSMSFDLVDCLHKCTENMAYKAACVQYSPPDDEHKMFETCGRQEELD